MLSFLILHILNLVTTKLFSKNIGENILNARILTAAYSFVIGCIDGKQDSDIIHIQVVFYA
jgi:hypothetical protein